MLVVLALGAVGLSVGLAFAVFPPRVTWDTDNRRAEMAACISEYRTDNPGAGVPEATLYCADDTRVTLAFYAPKHVQHVTLKRGLVVGVGLLVAAVLLVFALARSAPRNARRTGTDP